MATLRRRQASNATVGVAELERRMVLLGWLHARLGYMDTRELLENCRGVDEGFDSEGRSYALSHLLSRASALRDLTVVDLARYDANILSALSAMNAGRTTPIMLRYFQYLAALYAEIFLDFRFRRTAALLASLNEHFRAYHEYRAEGAPDEFDEADLNKLAFWMATGSGKTLLLHLNYRQFLRYCPESLDNIVLITPNEGLSEQHMAELALSGIRARPFTMGGTGWDRNAIQVTEITKLVLEKRGEGASVPVEAFEGNNLIFVDEGHKGSGGEAWRRVRDAIGSTGFTFEYSATFGQALTAARNEVLVREYGRAIVFDYSYRHFYRDGHGKDFRIVNLLRDPGERTDHLLLANLLAFHEQRTTFRTHESLMRRYNVAQPLWALVGASVNAVYSADRQKRSDVLVCARFFHRFLSDRAWAVGAIRDLLAGDSGLKGPDGDLMTGMFTSLRDADPDTLYREILAGTLHAEVGGGLQLAEISRAEGEVGLKVAGASGYFGVIYIGDRSSFKKLVTADESGITVELDAISESLFGDINRPGTTVEILIGARKFMEGWNSWRVSNMALLNLGRSEGSQIVQLFGRGVRLRGRGMKLKRSAALRGSHPPEVGILEKLNIFSLRANYMAEFREYLEREGVPTDPVTEMRIPIKPNRQWLRKGLLVPRVDPGRDYRRETVAVLAPDEGIGRVRVNLSARAQAITSGGVAAPVEAAGTATKVLPTEALELVDWKTAYLELAKYVDEREMGNLAVTADGLQSILTGSSTYELLADARLSDPQTLTDIKDLQDAVTAVLREYADRLHRRRQATWEADHMRFQDLDEDDGNLLFNRETDEKVGSYVVRVPESEAAFLRAVKQLLDSGTLYNSDLGELRRIHFDRHIYLPLLTEQAGEHSAVEVSPPGLNAGEARFVRDLREYWKQRDEDDLEVFLLRNLSRGKGVGFFEEATFYPDFILWLKRGENQRVVFVEPHGMVHAGAYRNDPKARLHERLPELARRMPTPGVGAVSMDSFIVSQTPFEELHQRYDDGSWTREQFAEKHILFPDDDYIPVLLGE